MICYNCKKTIPSESRYCPYCGAVQNIILNEKRDPESNLTENPQQEVTYEISAGSEDDMNWRERTDTASAQRGQLGYDRESADGRNMNPYCKDPVYNSQVRKASSKLTLLISIVCLLLSLLVLCASIIIVKRNGKRSDNSLLVTESTSSEEHESSDTVAKSNVNDQSFTPTPTPEPTATPTPTPEPTATPTPIPTPTPTSVPEETFDMNGYMPSHDNESFYGVWVSASKNESDVEDVAQRLNELGYDSSIIFSPAWENLNPEPYYCVTAGRYTSRSAAEHALDSIHKLGYSDAYIKFSGPHR